MVEKSINKDRLIKNFWALVTKQDINGIQEFLGKYRSIIPIDIRFPPMLHCTALHVAATKNNEQMAMLFIHEGVDINAQNKIGATALHLAARLGHVEMVNLLLRQGADYSIVDEQMHCSFEVAMWCVVEGALLQPLRHQSATLAACEERANRDHGRLNAELIQANHVMDRLLMEYEDMQSQAIEEWMAYMHQIAIEDQLRQELISLKRSLQQSQAEMQSKAAKQMNLREDLEGVFARYRTALANTQEAKTELHNQQNILEGAYHTKSTLSAIYADKLGILDAMFQYVNDVDVQLWGMTGLVHLTQDVTDCKPHEILLRQHVLQVVRGTVERFPFHAKIQEYAMMIIANICDALRKYFILHDYSLDTTALACELCMQERFIDNFQLARRRFNENDALLGQCIVALRALMMPRQPCEITSQLQLKFTCKFCAEDNSFVVDMLTKALNSNTIALQDLLPHLAGLLFVLAKYNARQVFLDRDNLGLRTVLAFLVRGNLREDIVRNLLGIASLLSLPDVKCPEQDSLPSCYISFGLPKVIPLIQKYASNPDVVMWGIRFLRNLAERDVMAKEQVNRSGIESILTQLISACESTTLRVSILQLLYIAFVTNYSRLNQVEELSTMVLNSIRDCLVGHQGSLLMQEWALKNFVIACKHPSNLEFLMESQESIEASVMQEILLPYTIASEYDDRKCNPVVLWAFRFLLLYYQYHNSAGGLHDRAKDHGACRVIVVFESFCNRSHDPSSATILNLLEVLRGYIGCECVE